jgi:aromatic-L-amino-acid/L-tryptophan decarboxylase
MIRSSSPFGVSAEALEAALSDAGVFVANEFVAPTQRPILPRISQAQFDAIIGTQLPQTGRGLDEVSRDAKEFLSRHTARIVPPGFSTMVTTSPNPYALLADVLACAVNQHVARGDVAEFASRLEMRCIEWIGAFLNYPAASGVLTSGGTAANLLALAAARANVLGEDARRKGVGGARLTAYASAEAHSSIERAVNILGIGTDYLRRIPVDACFRIQPQALEAAIQTDRAQGLTPFAVIAQGGSVVTGSVDSLDEVAAICERQRLWLHVDAAYGGPAAAVEEGRSVFAGLQRADSVTIDPHKWLYINYECGCLLFRKSGVVEAVLGGNSASYLKSDIATDAPDFMGRGLEISRGFRALKVWATFTGLGAQTLRLAISQDIRLAGYLAQLVDAHAHFELCAPTVLSIVVFRFVPASSTSEGFINALNERIPAELRSDGRIYMGSVRLGERVALRACLINHRVTDHDIRAWLEILTETGRKLDRDQAQWWQTSC